MIEPWIVSEQRFLDAGKQNEDGLYDYYYSGVYVVIEAGDVRFRISIYDDTRGLATFKTTAKGGWTRVEIDRDDPAFRATVELLVARYQINSVGIYEPTTGGYRTEAIATLFG